MKTKNKLASLSILAFVLLLPVAYADPWVTLLESSLTEINSFFVNEGYKPYAKAIDFFFFAFLFIAIYMMGVRYAFKEVRRAEKVIAILLGLMTALLLVLADFSVTILLPYVQWILYILLFILYHWLLKAMKSNFWRFMLALILTLLTIGLMQGLFTSLVPQAEGPTGEGISEFFKSFGDSFNGIQFEGFQPGVPDYLRDLFELPTVTTPSEPSTAQAGTTPAAAGGEPKDEGLPWWVWLLILGGLGGGIRFAWNKYKKNDQKPKEGAKPTGPVQPPKTLQEIIAKIADIINKKNASKNKIEQINRVKNNLIQQGEAKTGYIGRLRAIATQENGEEELANLFLDESKLLEEREEGNVKEIIKTERGFIQELKNLNEVEYEEIYKNIDNWKATLESSISDNEYKKKIENLLYILKVLIDENIAQRAEDKHKGILWLIAFCYNLEKKEIILNRDLSNLFEEGHIKDLVKGKFKEAIRDELTLEAYNQKENELIALLLQRIVYQIKLLELITRVLSAMPSAAPTVATQNIQGTPQAIAPGQAQAAPAQPPTPPPEAQNQNRTVRPAFRPLPAGEKGPLDKRLRGEEDAIP